MIRPFTLALRPVAAMFMLGLALAGLDVASQPAFAQAGTCQQIRAELASLGRSRGPSGATNRLRRELGSVQAALQNNDCYRTRGFLGLGGQAPICAPLKAQAGQLQAQINAMEGGGDEGRRAQLMAAWQRYGCDAPQRVEQAPPQQQRGVLYASPDSRPGIFDRLFGSRTEVPVEAFPPRGVAPPGVQPFDDSLQGEDGEVDDTPRRRRGGALAVCVRTCDGFFFPVNFEGLSARDEYSEVCKSLCPAAETRVFFMSHGGNIEDAATRDGEPYTALPNAKKYQENRDLSCICKQPGQTWASAMNGVTDLVELRKGDIVVSPEQALQMSRPKDAKVPQTSRQREAQKKLEARAVVPDAPDVPESALPTGGKASAGIGPRGQPRERFVREGAGVTTEITREDGSRTSVRNIAPDLGGAGLRSGSGEAKRP